MVRIGIVEDKQVIREGLALMLNVTEGMSSVGSYEGCEALLEDLGAAKPDLLLMDIGLPGMSGIEGIRRVRTLLPELPVLVLSIYEDEENVFQALCAGAVGYLVKNTPPERLVGAIREALEGGSPMSSRIARRVVELLRSGSPAAPSPDTGGMTGRERQVLAGLAEGDSYKMLADRLELSVDTVRFHIRNIYRKLHVHSQSAAVAKALRKGWI